MMRGLLRSVVLIAITSGCSGTETGNPGTARLALTAYASDPAIAAIGAPTAGNRIDAIWLSLQAINFVGCDADPMSAHSLGGPGVAELVAGAHPDASVKAGTYCTAELTLSPSQALGAVAASQEAAVVVRGTRSDGLPFTLVSQARLDRVLAAVQASFAVADGEDLLLAFDVSQWFAGTALMSATPSGGNVLIDSSTNAAALSTLEQQLSTALFRDSNANGHVDHDEASALASSLHSP